MKGTESRGQAFLFKRETTTPACSFRIVSRLNPTSTMPPVTQWSRQQDLTHQDNRPAAFLVAFYNEQ